MTWSVRPRVFFNMRCAFRLNRTEKSVARCGGSMHRPFLKYCKAAFRRYSQSPQNSYSRNFQNYMHNSENRYKSNGCGVHLYSQILTSPRTPACLTCDLACSGSSANLGATIHPIGIKDSPSGNRDSYHAREVPSSSSERIGPMPGNGLARATARTRRKHNFAFEQLHRACNHSSGDGILKSQARRVLPSGPMNKI